MGVKVREKPKGSGVWWVFIEHQGRRKAKKIGKEKQLAQKVAKHIQARLVLGDVGLLEKTKIPTFGDYAHIWKDITLPATCKLSTIKTYKGLLVNHVLPAFKNVPVLEELAHLKKFLVLLLHVPILVFMVNSVLDGMECTVP